MSFKTALGLSLNNLLTKKGRNILTAFAGSIGIGVTLEFIPLINSIIHNLTNNMNINASIPVIAALILIVLSVLLTLIGGIIPSRMASKKDPVEALRTE